MEEKLIEKTISAMNKPSVKMISATLMGVLLAAELGQEASNKKIESILPLLRKYSNELPNPLNTVFSVNLLVWSMPDNIRSGFFNESDLSFEGLIKTIQDGANEWHTICREKGMDGKSIQPLFSALKEIIEAMLGEDINEETMAHDILMLQDSFMESFDY